MKAPTRSDVISKLRNLVEGTVSREEVATWAQKWIVADEPPDMEEEVWEVLEFLVGVDMISTDRPYLFSVEDFKRELAKLQT